MNYYLIITALTVSIDSFLCGFSLSLNQKNKMALIVIITLTVYIMCLFTNYATFLLKNYITEKTVCFAGLILIGVGLFNLFKKEKGITNKRNFLLQAFSTGFAVGLDGCLANLSLSLMGINKYYVPLTIAVCHGIMIFASIMLSKTKIIKKIEKFNYIAPIILIGLGIYKFLGLFF